MKITTIEQMEMAFVKILKGINLYPNLLIIRRQFSATFSYHIDSNIMPILQTHLQREYP